MKRDLEDDLIQWISEENRKPIVFRGARQVGKSTLIRNFAKSQKLELLEINLEQHRHLQPLFDSLNFQKIKITLESHFKTELTGQGQLLFFDEAQAVPSVLACLRYFYEDHSSLPVITAGSLLEFTLKDHQFSMPVGRIEYRHLGPMNFKEFLLALKENYLLRLIEEFDLSKCYIDEDAHKQLTELLKVFLIVGGMPEAVLEYSKNRNFNKIERIHQSIISTYKDDFSKYKRTDKDLLRLHNIFKFIPAHVGQKIKYSNISKEDQARETKVAIELLSLARILIKVFHCTGAGVPLDATINSNIFKCFFLDVGLVNRICGLQIGDLDQKENRKIINEGGVAEQFIAQHLYYRKKPFEDPSLNYWLRDGKSNNAEVDFLISVGQKIIPIEVKSGKSGTLRSLHQFLINKKERLALRFDLSLPSFESYQIKIGSDQDSVEYTMLSLPLYFVTETDRLLRQTTAL